MTDRLDRALDALREAETGANPRAQETLERVLRNASASPRARSKATLWLPIAAVLAISTAALAQSGMRETLRGLFWRPLDSPPSMQTRQTSRRSPEATSTVPPSIPAVSSESASSVAIAASPARSATVPLRPSAIPDRARPAASQATDPTPSAMQAATQAATAAPAPSAPSEEDVYERAHRLHFEDRNPAASIGAWNDYLGRFPSGRFVPEAQYNRAIDLLKLRRNAEARAALLPFANGDYGAYHREDARDLLRAIP